MVGTQGVQGLSYQFFTGMNGHASECCVRPAGNPRPTGNALAGQLSNRYQTHKDSQSVYSHTSVDSSESAQNGFDNESSCTLLLPTELQLRSYSRIEMIQSYQAVPYMILHAVILLYARLRCVETVG